MNMQHTVSIVGGGLAGCEAAWQCAIRGLKVHLYEMRPVVTTGAHTTANLAELVCSNSFGSTQPDRASGILINELRRCNSLLLECATASIVPAGNALAVDRDVFSRMVTKRISAQINITIFRQEVTEILPSPTIIATGPLTSPQFAQSLSRLTGEDNLYFFDAIAPIIYFDSINMDKAYRGSRYKTEDEGEGDYINCPFTKEEYETFVQALTQAETITLRDFEVLTKNTTDSGKRYFEGCLPVEVLAKRSNRALAFGPMRPIGLKDHRTGKGAYAVIQLRRDNIAGNLYNIVGFQTNLTYLEQKRIFHMIPGLEEAEFVRMGQMHRNTFISSPKLLLPTLQYKYRPDLFFAGQITGVEGYMGNIGTGIVSAWNISRFIKGWIPLPFPRETILGSLCHYISHAAINDFQPMKANLGILPELVDRPKSKLQRAKYYSTRSQAALDNFISDNAWE
jgi:methylenetetrahydrofolate--tRNA-(uracil-5-)-methyltransferase